MDFEKRKAAAMTALMNPEPDKSPKGNLDAPIIPLLAAINRHPSLFTTSSCSGRITILSQPTNATAKKKKAGGGGWIFATHDLADPDSVVGVLFSDERKSFGTENENESLVFRFEPLIIAVECRDAEAAQWLVSMSISSGFRESGITSIHKRIMVAIRCSIRLEVPLGVTSHIMVSPEFVRYLVGIANEKMEVNWRRTDGFFQVLLQQTSPKLMIADDADVYPKKDRSLNDQQKSVHLKAKKESKFCSMALPMNDGEDIDTDDQLNDESILMSNAATTSI